MKLNDVKIKWTSGAACPEGFHLDRTYYILSKNDKFYVSDGNFEQEIKETAIKNIFTPIDGVKWEDVIFSNEVKFKNK